MDNNECRILKYVEGSSHGLIYSTKLTYVWMDWWSRQKVSDRIISILTKIQTKQLMCKIWGFHSGDYEEWRLLGCYAVWPEDTILQTTPEYALEVLLLGPTCLTLKEKKHKFCMYTSNNLVIPHQSWTSNTNKWTEQFVYDLGRMFLI
jgi:hypothetical protein